MKLRFSFVIASLVGSLAGCSAAASSPEDIARDDAPLTDIELSPNVQQTVSNCWSMTTTAWIESLSRRPEGATAVDLSEAYVSYRHWFFQLVDPGFMKLNVLGSYGVAAELLRSYGWMTEQEFLGQSAPATMATRHASALGTIQWELTGGELRTPELRADRANVIRVLNRAWGVPPDVAAELQQVFGPEYTRWIVPLELDLSGTRIHRLSEIPVGTGDDGAVVTAADVIGTPESDDRRWNGMRAGKYAFSNALLPDADVELRGYFRRAQKALLQDLPLVTALYYEQQYADPTGTFQAPTTPTLETSNSHMVLAYDLTVDAPGFGVLRAGVREDRADAREATLDDAATILAFRTKNSSFGNYFTPGQTFPAIDGTPGINDFTLAYLTKPMSAGARSKRALEYMVLPNDPDVVFEK